MTDGDLSRRAVLHRLGVGAGAVTTATTDWGGVTDLGPDDWDPGAPAWADVQTPDTITYPYDGESYTIHLVPAEVESCAEYLTWADTQPQNSSRLPTPGITHYNQGVFVPQANIETDGEIGGSQTLGVQVSDITGCTYRAQPRIEVLDWRPDYELTEACRLSYCEMFRRAIEHEIHHVRDVPKFKQAFESWVASNRQQFLATTWSGDESFRTAVGRQLAELAVEFHDGRTLEDGSYMRGSGPWTHERIGTSTGWDCESCADCREVSGTNWTYKDVETWRLDVSVGVRVEMEETDPQGDTARTRLRNRYDGTFELEKVPADTIRRLMGGARAVQETRRRIENARGKLSAESFFSTVPEAVGALRGGDDPISDGQPPLLWRGGGNVSGLFELAYIEPVHLLCSDESEEGGRRIRASGTVSPTEMQSTAFVAILPTDNVVKCFWPDVWVPGTDSEIEWTCEDEEPKENVDTTHEGRHVDIFANLGEGGVPEPEVRDAFRLYSGAWGVLRDQVEQVRNGSKDPGGHSQTDLDEVTDDIGQFLAQQRATEGDVRALLSEGLAGPFGQALVRQPFPFWTVDDCQRGAFSETVQRDLYARYPDAIMHRYNTHMEPYRNAGNLAEASTSRAGTEFVHVRLRPEERDHGDEHEEIQCNGINR
ncbi:hypothetical protein [Haloarcula halophila]|uniref:hypothetical protein n=1 Tax=Haloarcula TaxID=2237 RepID=UPI0023E4303B|nr:hypothetical protein [Halomicroarcula sp. DFY41]